MFTRLVDHTIETHEFSLWNTSVNCESVGGSEDWVPLKPPTSMLTVALVVKSHWADTDLGILSSISEGSLQASPQEQKLLNAVRKLK